MAREIRYILSFFLFLLVSLLCIQTAWGQVNAGASNVNVEEAVFVEYTSTVFVEPNDSDGNIVEVDPDDLNVDFDDEPSGKVSVSDFEPVIIRRELRGYAAEISSSVDQELEGRVMYDDGARPSNLGDFETKFQEISERSITETVEDNALADGEDEVIIGVRIIDDDNGSPISGIRDEDFELNFKAAGPPEVESIEEDSDRDGIYFIAITNTEDGSGSYELGVAGRFIGSDSFTFESAGPIIDAGTSDVDASTPHDADGSDMSEVTIQVRDSDGSNLFTEVSLSDFDIELSGSASLGDGGENSSAQEFFFLVTNTVEEVVTVTVNVEDPDTGEMITLDDEPEIEFLSVPETELSSISATSPHIANGSDPSVVTLEIRDGGNNAIETLDSDDFDISLSTPNASATDVGHEGGGEYQFEVTSTDPEQVRVTVDARGERIGTTDIIFQEAIDFVDARRSDVDATSPHVPDGSDASVVTAVLKDRDGDGIEGIDEGSLSLSVESGNGDHLDLGSFSATGNTGEFEAEVTSTQAGEFELAVNVNGTKLAETADIEFENPQISSSNSTLELETSNPHDADGQDAAIVIATLLDEDNNPVSTDFVDHVFSDLSGDAEINNFTTDADNEFVFEIVNSTPETVTFGVSFEQDDTTIELDDTVEIEFLPLGTGVSESSSLVTITPDEVDADGESIAFLTVELRDDDESLISDVDIDDITVDLGGSSAEIINQAHTEQYEFEIVNSVPETVTVTISIDDPREGTLTLDRQPTVEFIEVKDDADPELTNISTSGSATADGDDEIIVTIELRNSSNEPINNYDSDDFDVEVSNNGNASDVEQTDDENGIYEFSVTNNRSGTVEIDITARGTQLPTQTAEFEPVETVVDASSSSVEATSPHDADGSDASIVTVNLVDDQGDPMDDVSTSSFDINLTGNAEASDVSNEGGGEYEFLVTNTSPETVTVTVTVEGIELDDTPQIEFEFDDQVDPELSSVATTGSANADGNDEVVVTIELRNSNNDPINNFGSNDFDVDVSGNASASDVDLVDDDNGVYEFRVTNNTAETVQVSIAAGGESLGTHEIDFDEVERVVDASSSSVEATSPHDADGSDASMVSVNLVDDQGDPMDDVSTGSFDIDLTGNAEASDVSNAGGGEYEFQVANTTAETVTVTVTVEGIELDDTPQIVFEQVDVEIPDPPIIGEVEDVDTGIEIRWEIGTMDIVDEFRIYRGSSASELELYDTVPSGKTTYIDDNPLSGTNFYAVSAVNELDEEGDLSNLVNFYNGVLNTSGEWRMVSTPVSGTHTIDNNITAFAFTNRYEHAESMTSTQGYWMKSSDDSAQEFAIRGKGETQVSLELNEGWNMIGGIADEVAVSDIVDPGGILTQAPVYYYSNGEYESVELLEPNKGYWLYVTDSGTVELSVESSQITTEDFSATASKSVVNHDRDFPKLEFSSNGVNRSLKIDEHHLSEEEKYAYLLPPPAPEQPLNVRSEDGFGIISSDGGTFTVEAEDYPVTVNLEENGNPGDNFYQLVLRNGNSEHTVSLDPNSTIELTTEYDEIALVTTDSDETISEHKLLPNYPNPFNPATTIEYQLSQNTQVLLEVYDVSGRRVQVLANDTRPAGHYSAEFDGRKLASGMYMVRFQAGNEVQIRKITLIK